MAKRIKAGKLEARKLVLDVHEILAMPVQIAKYVRCNKHHCDLKTAFVGNIFFSSKKVFADSCFMKRYLIHSGHLLRFRLLVLMGLFFYLRKKPCRLKLVLELVVKFWWCNFQQLVWQPEILYTFYSILVLSIYVWLILRTLGCKVQYTTLFSPFLHLTFIANFWYYLCILFQCLDLSNEMKESRVVEVVDIVNDKVADHHYKESEDLSQFTSSVTG